MPSGCERRARHRAANWFWQKTENHDRAEMRRSALLPQAKRSAEGARFSKRSTTRLRQPS